MSTKDPRINRGIMRAKKSTKPEVSIIILNHNAEPFLKDTLNSIRLQRGVSYEVIIVDNHSSDNSKDMVAHDFPDFHWIQRNTSLGFSAGNNIGVKEAMGDVILFLNPDASFQKPDDLKKCYDKLVSDHSIGCLTCRVNLALNNKIDETCHRGFPTPWASFTHFSGLSKLLPNVPLFNQYTKRYLGYDNEHEIDAVGGMFMLIPRHVGDKVGWWDEDYPLYGEDLDFCYRIHQIGYRNLYYPKVTILHYKGVSTGMSKQSKSVSTASGDTTRFVKGASVVAMRLFYHKHYQNKYPFFINQLVYLGLKIMYFIRVRLA